MMDTTNQDEPSRSLGWSYTWEDPQVVTEPLRDEERCLLKILKELEQPYKVTSPPPLWDNEGYTYDPKNPDETAPQHYCLVDNNKFAFSGDLGGCKCDPNNLYHFITNTVLFCPYLFKEKAEMMGGASEKELELRRRAVSHVAKYLRDNCDKIFDRSVPFVVEAATLKRVIDAINTIFDTDRFGEEDQEYQDLVLFLADFCQQTPSLCITLSKFPKHSSSSHAALSASTDVDSSYGGGSDRDFGGKPSTSSAASTVSSSTSTTTRGRRYSSAKSTVTVAESSRTDREGGVGAGGSSSGSSSIIDISLFKSLVFLELRNVPPTRVTGLNGLRLSIKSLKCSRNLKSINQLLQTVESASGNVASIWPELKELDLSYNRICYVRQDEISVLELCPSLESLNLSRNKIGSVDDHFSRISSCLSTLNLCYNKLTTMPQVPCTVKVLLLSNNLIGTLNYPKHQDIHAHPFDPFLAPHKNLQVLDLSNNLISNESELIILKDMCKLRKLNLAGNPLSFKDKYRKTVSGYLSRFVISRKFELDKRCLSTSEVKIALKDAKEEKFSPYLPSSLLAISQAHSAMSTSLSSGASMSTSTSMQQSTMSGSQSQMKMSQSFDSTSSSMRSLRRKKPKIREILNYDLVEDRENSSCGDGSSKPDSASISSSSDFNKNSEAHAEAEKMRKMLTALRERHQEHWLRTNVGKEVERILRIPERPVNYEYLSRSLPDNQNKTPPDKSSLFYERALSSERYTNEELLLINTKKGRVTSSSSSTGSKTPLASNSNTPKNQGTGEEGDNEFLSIYKTNANPEEISIFDMSKDETPEETFDEEHVEGEFQSFRIFHNGEVFKLIVHDSYLMEVNPETSVVISKWDLQCLYDLEEEKCSTETESVQFRLKFNTMRKSMRERSFIMTTNEFHRFDKAMIPYINEKTLKEFTDALQCGKCFAQFSRGTAGRTLKHEKGQPPREVRTCPNVDCGSDVLLTLDNIPLPNNECLDYDDMEGTLGAPMQASTPVSVRTTTLSQSIPQGRSPRMFDLTRLFPSSLTPKKGDASNTDWKSSLDSKSSSGVQTVYAAKSSTPTSSGSGGTCGTGATNTKSESDIEVLSTDSSSIEVLGRHCPDSGSASEVDIEEGIEIPTIDGSTTSSKLGGRVQHLSDSTSSSSCADSIVTTYEKHLLPISQPLNTPSRHPSAGSSTNVSLTSTSTLTPSTPVIHSTMPLRYDYVNFAKIDHRLHLWAEVSVFKDDEVLMALTKCMVISGTGSTGNFLGIIVFSTKKVYVYKIVGDEGDQPQEWLQKVAAYDLAKFTKLDVLIGRHALGVDFSGKYFALVFRDSQRTSGFLEFFISDICNQLDTPPMVRDFSQTQKLMLSPNNPISYFGVLRYVMCETIDNLYPVSAILLTNEEILLITELGWMAGKSEKVTSSHGKQLATLRQVELLESDGAFIRLVFGIDEDRVVNWEIIFETVGERSRFQECLRSSPNGSDITFVCLSQPLES